MIWITLLTLYNLTLLFPVGLTSLYFHLRTVVRLWQSFFMYANTIENMKTTFGKVYTFITIYCRHSLYLQIFIKILLLPPNFCLLSSLLWFLLKCLLLLVQLSLVRDFLQFFYFQVGRKTEVCVILWLHLFILKFYIEKFIIVVKKNSLIQWIFTEGPLWVLLLTQKLWR